MRKIQVKIYFQRKQLNAKVQKEIEMWSFRVEKNQAVQQVSEIQVGINKSTSASPFLRRLYLANDCVSCLNNSTPAIKFTYNDFNREINFLTDKKRLSEMGKNMRRSFLLTKQTKYQSRHSIQNSFLFCKF